MSNLSVFAFESQDVRFVGTSENPEWVAQDICKCLDLDDTSKALEPLESDEKGTSIIRTPGGNQEVLTVTEPGLFRLIFKSRKPVAKRFQRWVFHEVLPSIRNTGSYTVSNANPASDTPDRVLIHQINHLFGQLEQAPVNYKRRCLHLAKEIGDRLSQLRDQHKHGQWEAFCRANLISPNTGKPLGNAVIARYIRISRRWAEIEAAGVDTLTAALRVLSRTEPKTRKQLPPAAPPPVEHNPKLRALNILHQATATATQIEALPDGSSLKAVLTNQLSRTLQLLTFNDLTEAMESAPPKPPLVQPDPLSVADFAKLNGRTLSPYQAQQAGLQAARMYRNRRGENPPKKSVAINGSICQVNLYPASDWDLVESAIALAVEA
jgi:prophage antirepressor-like protein